MNSYPSRSVEHEIEKAKAAVPTKPTPDALVVRDAARDVLEAGSLAGVKHPDEGTLARTLDAPAVLDNRTLALITMLASGAALPGCDGSTALCVLCSAATFIALVVGVGYGAKKYILDNFVVTKTLKTREVGVFVRHGLVGNFVGVKFLGKPAVEAYEARPVSYWTFDQEYEGGYINQPVNYPLPKENADGTMAEGDNDFTRKLEAKDNVEYVFTWSVLVEVIPDVGNSDENKLKFYGKFKKGLSNQRQTGLIYDLTQKALSDVVAKKTFLDVTDANSKRDAISAEVQTHPNIKLLRDEFAIKATVSLGDIAAPPAVVAVAEERRVVGERAKMVADKVAIAKGEGDAIEARADGEVAAFNKLASAKTAALTQRIHDFGLTDGWHKVAITGVELLPDVVRAVRQPQASSSFGAPAGLPGSTVPPAGPIPPKKT